MRFIPAILGTATLAGVAVLLSWDAFPGLFPAGSHKVLAAFSLAMIAIAYLTYQIPHRPPAMELLKAIMLAFAFLFWAANQLWPDLPQATLCNDIAIALFVFDLFLVITGRRRSSPDGSFAEARQESCAKCRGGSCKEKRCCADQPSAG